MGLPPEKIIEMKQIIHNHLSQLSIQKYIKDALSEVMTGSDSEETINEEKIISSLKQRGVVEDILKQLQLDSKVDDTADRHSAEKPATHFIDKMGKVTIVPLKRANIDPTRRYLYLQLLDGRAFLEHLQEPSSPLPGNVHQTFMLHVNYRGQRFQSRPIPCACEPDFNEGFLLEVHNDSSGDASSMADASTILSLCDRIHLVLVKTDLHGVKTLIASYWLEWRTILADSVGKVIMAVELLGVGSESKVPIGVLNLTLELIPRMTQCLTADIVATQISMERRRHAERERLFLLYAKQWWKEYLQIRESHAERLVKIFAQDENCINRPVCAYVQPMRAGRLLDSPRMAARFVSLFAFERTHAIGGGEALEQWCTMHAFLCRKKGDIENHAVLLCSLLIGFGLDAYVCIGSKSKGHQSWVATITTDGQILFWDSVSGNRYSHQPIQPGSADGPHVPRKPKHPYKTIGCMFNDRMFYANCQPTNRVDVCIFDLSDESKWKAMSEDAIKSVCGTGVDSTWPNVPNLCTPTIDTVLMSNDIEYQLRDLVCQHRLDMGLSTQWDDHLCYLLTPALAAYELERTTGVTFGNEEFQDAVRRCVPDGHTFKGYPVQFVHFSTRRLFASCLKSPVCEEIVACRGDHVRLGVRVRVFTYPEDICSVWIMFAVKYKSVL